MSEQQIPRITYRQLRNFKERCANLYHIKTKNNELKNFIFHDAQEILNDVVEEEFRRSYQNFGVHQCRIIVLKPRQMGCTTYSCTRMYDMLTHIDMAGSLLIANDIDTSDLVYDIVRRLHRTAPEKIELVDSNGESIIDEEGNPAIIPFKVPEKNQSGKKFVVVSEGEDGDKKESRLSIRTAGAEGSVGVGGTINCFVASEASRYPDYKATMSSASPSFTETGKLFSVIESTANGVSGIGEGFYNAWTKAVNNWERFQRGETKVFRGYRPVFIPWWIIPEYRLSLAGGKLTPIDNNNCDFGSKEEQEKFFETEKMLMEGIEHPLTKEIIKVPKEAINWYRHAIINIKDGDYRLAKQDYPTFPEDAFHSTDHCYFNTTQLQKVKTLFSKEPPENEFTVGELVYDDDGEMFFEESGSGNLYIKTFPDPNYTNRYIVSLDESEGHEDGDYACMFVYDRLDGEFVAKWYGKVPEDLLAGKFIDVGLFYNEALLAPERNFATVVNMTNPDSSIMPYLGPYHYEFVGKGSDLRWGVRMQDEKRDMILSQYRAWLRGQYDKIFDMSSLDEHINFVRHEKRGTKRGYKYEAASGKHDDQVMAKSIAIEAAEKWDETIDEYNPQKIKKILRPRKDNIKYLKQSRLGQQKKKAKERVRSLTTKQSSLGKRN